MKSATATPTAMPSEICQSAWRKMPPSKRPGCAPRAVRIAISVPPARDRERHERVDAGRGEQQHAEQRGAEADGSVREERAHELVGTASAAPRRPRVRGRR